MKIISLYVAILLLSVSVGFADETNSVSRLTKEGREARKAQTVNRFDLDGNGKLDRAERSLLYEDLKSKMDPTRKRIVFPRETTPTSPPQ